jgi:hypothetical protein
LLVHDQLQSSPEIRRLLTIPKKDYLDGSAIGYIMMTAQFRYEIKWVTQLEKGRMSNSGGSATLFH